MNQGFFHQRPPPPRSHSSAAIFLVLLWLAGLGMMPAPAMNDLKVVVPRSLESANKSDSAVLWAEVEKKKNSRQFFFTNAEVLDYATEHDLVEKMRTNIINLDPEDFLLVLGPATSGEAIALGQGLTNLDKNLDHVLFVSTTVTTAANSFSGLPLVRACLSDPERIEQLSKLAPKEWSQMSAALLASDDSWGRQLLDILSAQTNLFSSLSPHLIPVNPTNSNRTFHSDQIAKLAAESFKRQDALIFIALEDASDVEIFLKDCHYQSSFLSPYKPMICLLQDYRFSNADAQDAINLDEIGKWCSITMISVSDPVSPLGSKIETPGLYATLDDEFLSILQAVETSHPGGPATFLKNIRAVFEDRTNARNIVGPVPGDITTSQYFLYQLKSKNNGEDDPVAIKWLRTPWSYRFPLTGSSPAALVWKSLEKDDLDKWSYYDRAKFADDIFCARIPWLSRFWLVLLALATLVTGLLIEIRKRFIFVCRDRWSLTGRVLAWCLIVLLIFSGVIYLCLSDTLNVTSFKVLLGICLAPLAVFPMLQNAALAKVPLLKGILEWPTEQLENLMDFLVNSRAKKLKLLYERKIKEELQARVSQHGLDEAQQENFLWNWWFDSLKMVKPESLAVKLFDRFIPQIEVWNKTLNVQTRIGWLIEALAYTSMVIEETKKNEGE